MNPILEACKVAGSQAAFAELVGVSPSMVSQWVSGHRPVPVERCAAIEKISKGAATRKDLRPDDWAAIWPELEVSA